MRVVGEMPEGLEGTPYCFKEDNYLYIVFVLKIDTFEILASWPSCFLPLALLLQKVMGSKFGTWGGGVDCYASVMTHISHIKRY